MKSYAVHFLNKYPGGSVDYSEDKLRVYDANGFLVVALALGGNGAIKDIGAEVGARDGFCLSPIPRNARVFKLLNSGAIGHDELASSRKVSAQLLAKGNRIESIEFYKSKSDEYTVDQHGNVELLKKAAPASPEAPSSGDQTPA